MGVGSRRVARPGFWRALCHLGSVWLVCERVRVRARVRVRTRVKIRVEVSLASGLMVEARELEY